jgi:hypothetical protein
MCSKSVKLAFVIALSIIVILGTLTFSNSNYYVMALKRYHKTLAESKPLSSYSNSSNSEFYKIIDGQRNRCHNDNNLDAVVCTKEDTETRSPIGRPVTPQNISNSSVRIPIVNQSVATTNSSAASSTTPSTQNESSLQAVGPTNITSNDNSNADTSAIFSTPMTSESLGSFLDSKKSSSEIPQTSSTTATTSDSIPQASLSSSASTSNPSIQAALSFSRATQSNNIVNTKAVYDIVFGTATTGVIKTITITFPAGFALGNALILEATGIGPGTIALSGSVSTGETLTYTVANAVSVPAHTTIRFEIANIINAANPNCCYEVSITTRNAGGGTIDGPSVTTVFAIKQIGKADVSSSFIKQRQLLDDAAGHAAGWNPDGFNNIFNIVDADVTPTSVISITTGNNVMELECFVNDHVAGVFQISCNGNPVDGATLTYTVTKANLS